MAEKVSSQRSAIWVALIGALGLVAAAVVTAELTSSGGSGSPSRSTATAVNASPNTGTATAEPSAGGPLTAAEQSVFDDLDPSHVALTTCTAYRALEQEGALGAIECTTIPALSNKAVFASYANADALDQQGLNLYARGRAGTGSCQKGQFYNGSWDLPDGATAGEMVCTTFDGGYEIASGFRASNIMVLIVDAKSQAAYAWWNNYISVLFLH